MQIVEEMEIKENTIIEDIVNDDVKEQFDNAVWALCDCIIPSTSAYVKLGKVVAKFPFEIRNLFFLKKLCDYIYAVDELDEGSKIKINNTLFGEEDQKSDNAFRILNYIDKVESFKKNQYIINATRAISTDALSKSMFFRIIDAVTRTLNEDLDYLSSVSLSNAELSGNISLISLANKGLAIQSRLDNEENIEEQKYVITELGRFVDRYALSYRNEAKQNAYKHIKMKSELKFNNGLSELSSKDVTMVWQTI